MSAGRKVTDVLSPAEIRELTRASDVRGALAVLTSWAIVVGSTALVAWQANAFTVFVALVLIGGRQLGLSILMHEAAHRSLFRTRWLNDVVGVWLCAAPAWGRLHAYREHHLGHHAHTGSERDPDLGLVTPFPVSRASLLRKFARDFTGVAGVRRVGALLLMDFGYLTYTASTGAKRGRPGGLARALQHGGRNFGPTLVTNLALFGVCWWIGRPSLYALWAIAYLTTFSFFVRLRAMAEHACTGAADDDFANTRTVLAGPLARLTCAPHRVNFHLEHHLLPTVPYWQLPRMHEMLRERGALDQSPIACGYLEVLQTVSRGASPA